MEVLPERRLLLQWLEETVSQCSDSVFHNELVSLLAEYQSALRLASDWLEIVEWKSEELRDASELLAKAQTIVKRVELGSNQVVDEALISEARQVASVAYSNAENRSAELQTAKLGAADADRRADQCVGKVRLARERLSQGVFGSIIVDRLVPGSATQSRFDEAMTEAEELAHSIDRDLAELFEEEADPVTRPTSPPVQIIQQESVDDELRRLMDDEIK